MNSFKKLGCMAMAGAMLACSCVTVNAERVESADSSVSFDVKAKYSAGVVAEVYAVDIEWESMEFEYTSAGTTWDPEKHEYVTTTEASWTERGNGVTVTNHSNKPITATLSYTADAAYPEIEGEFTVASQTLASAVGTSKEEAPYFTSYLELSGALDTGVTTLTKVGSAKVQISAPNAMNSAQAPSNPATGNGGGSTSGDHAEPTLVGYIRFAPRVDEYNRDAREAEIYMQGEGVYVAEICLDKVLPAVSEANTEIVIDGNVYYIQKVGNGATFSAGETVIIGTAPIDTGFQSKPLRKETVLEANKKYILTINIDASGAGTATLEEVTD